MSEKIHHSGRHFLQIPGPTPVPERIHNAMSKQILDHRGPEFQTFAQKLLGTAKDIFGTTNPVMLYPSSGTGAWEAAFVNTLSAGDTVLMVETGQFATLWKDMALNLGLKVEFLSTDWRIGADAQLVEDRLRQDTEGTIKAVCVVHNETATGCRSWIEEIRKAMDDVGHDALLMVDTISSIGCMEYLHDEWRVDVAIGGSQKGLMVPPGVSFNAVSDKALEAAKSATLMRSYWSWKEMLRYNADGFFPYTPPTGLLYGLEASFELLQEEGLKNVYARHERLAAAVRAAVEAWGLEVLCRDAKYYSPAVTSVVMPKGHNSDDFRIKVLETFNMSLGMGLTKLKGKVFRIGHLGDTNALTVLGALSGVEMGLEVAGVPHSKGGVDAAMGVLAKSINEAVPARAA